MRSWKSILIIGAVLALVGTAGACTPKNPAPESSAAPSSQVEDVSVFPEGASVGGKDISGKTSEEALEIARQALAEQAAALEVTVKFRDDTVALSGADFETHEVLELVIPRLLAERLSEDYPLPYATDLSAQGKAKLSQAAKACYVAGKDATISGYDGSSGAFTFTDEQKGSRADLATTLKSVRKLLSLKQGGAIQAPFLETSPKLTKQFLSEHFKLMSSYTTTSTNNSNGNSNMALALRHINGTILQPGGEFSYNTVLGNSTDPNAGWLPAGGLMGGLSVQMYGGGICQGSTTLYNAALMAGMEILERECHSIPSSYCPLGLDATVDYGNIDFRFRNPLSTPVYISSWMDGVTLYVNFYGCFPEEWDKITVGSEQTGSEAPLSTVSFREDENLSKGEYVLKSSGRTGYSAHAWRTYYKGETQVKTEDLSSSYYPAGGRIYAVGKGTDTDKVDTTRESGSTEAAASPVPSPTPSAAPPTASPATPAPTPDPTPEPVPEPSSQAPTEAPTQEPQPEETPQPDPDPDESGTSSLVEWA